MSDKNELELVEIKKGRFLTRREALRKGYDLIWLDIGKPKPGQPIIPPGGLGRLAQLAGIIAFAYGAGFVIRPITDSVVHTLFEAAGLSPNTHRPPTPR